MKDITQRMGIENKCLRQLDESWEQEYNVLERRLNDTLFCYEKEKQVLGLLSPSSSGPSPSLLSPSLPPSLSLPSLRP